MQLIAFPLLLVPFALYNMIAFLLNMPFTQPAFTVPLMENGQMDVSIGDLLVAVAMMLLYLEFLKAARFGTKTVMDHMLSLILFVAMAAELVLVPRAATSTLFLLAVLAFVDLITGLSVGAQRSHQEIVIEDTERVSR